MLLVLQGMDTSGKGGVLRHTVGLVDPQGVKITSFKAPTDEERKHDFLWRIRKALPEPGYVGVFDRSHYEDVLIVRVHELADAGRDRAPVRRDQRLRGRAGRRRHRDRQVHAPHLGRGAEGAAAGPARQREQVLEVQPRRHRRARVTGRDYRTAYEIALERTNTEVAPWYVVPADKKWYRNLAIGELLLEHLRGMNLQWPPPDFDVDEQRRRLLEEAPLA